MEVEECAGIETKSFSTPLTTLYLLIAIDTPHNDVTSFEAEALVRAGITKLVGRVGMDDCTAEVLLFDQTQNLILVKTDPRSAVTIRSCLCFITFFRSGRCRLRTVNCSSTLPFMGQTDQLPPPSLLGR
eukprot:GHVS01050031.1.p1 GENE.GHVS01050031.1~~GHVS01050031.1.p1  ORF type:complete len:139 (+),score=17.86 GHVS01050031.1:32-418(+)